MRALKTIVLIAFTCGVCLISQGQIAPESRQDAVSREELQTLREALAAQQKQLDALRSELAALKTQPPTTGAASATSPNAPPDAFLEKNPAAPGTNAGWNGSHFFISAREGAFQFQPIGYFQLDQHSYSGSSTPENTFLIRRARLGAQGQVNRYLQYKIEADFADRINAILREASFTIGYSPRLQFKAGQFKLPFSQELLTSDTDSDFVERSLAANILMGDNAYSPGIQIQGEAVRGILEYQVAAANGKGSLIDSETSAPEAVLRLRLSPWRKAPAGWLSGFEIGGAVARGETRNGQSFLGAPPTATFTFFPQVPVNGDVLRTNAEISWTNGPVALRAEYDQGRQERRGLGFENADLPAIVARGYYLTGTWLLTGEKRPRSGQPVPRRALFSDGGAGAWELKFRYSGQQMKDGGGTARGDEFSTGFNWYMNSLVTYLFDVNLERLRTPVAASTPLQPQNFITVLSRLQFRF